MKSCIIDVETGALHPTEGRIICVGIKDADSGSSIVFYDDDEKQMLIDFIDYFSKKGFNEIIGYNVLFDIRFIFAKLLKYEISSRGFFKSNFKDLMATMKSVRTTWSLNRPGTLQEWSEFLFEEGKTPIPASIAELYACGMIDKIIEYNRQDLELTFKLWKRVEMVLWE